MFEKKSWVLPLALAAVLRWMGLLGIGLLWSVAANAQPPDVEFDARPTDRPARAALFQAPGFPTVDAPVIGDATLAAATSGLPVDVLSSVDELNEELRLRTYDALILPYGSAFPLDAWPVLRAFVKKGGSLVVLGGAPFHQPVRLVSNEESHDWVLGIRQPTFAHEFLLGPADVWTRDEADESYGPLVTEPATTESGDPAWSDPAQNDRFPDPSTVYELIVRLASLKDLPAEHGSEGHRDAILRPLVHVKDADGHPRACPLLEIDRIRGNDAGARWVLAPSDAELSSELIRSLVERALEGAAQLDARPVYASLEPGETPIVRVVQRRPFVRDDETVPDTAELVVSDDAGQEIARLDVPLVGQATSRHGSVDIQTPEFLAPGFYRVDVTTPEGGWSHQSSVQAASTGFWVRDEALLKSGPKITVSRDWLRKNGEVMPVNGTTYMSSDVQRKFLFEPDPLTWDRDFAQMASLGINFVRTGLWTGHDRAMLNSGAIDEAFLRSLDAWVQTGARHGIVVNYTFFAFRPQTFGADNPYIDPRAIEGQRELLTLVASRFRDIGWVHWDLINEPSYAPASALWSNTPIGDVHEEREWKLWLTERHGDLQDPETIALLRDRWRDPTRWVVPIPHPSESDVQAIREHRRPRKVRDFHVFSQGLVTEWARTLRQILRDAGGDVLVTLGQDEGGTFTRPSQQIHAEAVDYTGIHPWWRNDDILASGVMAKVPEKPNLFQETGIMRLEDLDGWSWRTPEIAAQTLERKYANAFASRGAGVIEWAWNINPYQPIDNESVIGFIRPDGTLKPEIRIVPELARFFEQAAPWLDDFEPAEVVAVIPHSRLLMGRPGGAEGFKRLIRVMAERHGVVPLGLSELMLTPERLAGAKLILVPSPLFLEDDAAEALVAASRAGSKILVSGPLTGNPYGEMSPALEELGADEGRPVRLRESTPWGAGRATFGGDKREQYLRSTAPDLDGLSGDIWREPLPLDFAAEDEPLSDLLAAALDAAGVETHPSDARVAARLLYAPKAVFAILTNETDSDASRRMMIEGRAVEIPVEAGRYRLALFERGTGELVAITSGDEVTLGHLETSERR